MVRRAPFWAEQISAAPHRIGVTFGKAVNAGSMAGLIPLWRVHATALNNPSRRILEYKETATTSPIEENLMRQEISIVLYHHIADDKHLLTKQLGVTTRPDTFERHIRYFAQNFDFVSGYELITGALPRKPILVTFDDAYRSVLDVAGPILKAVN